MTSRPAHGMTLAFLMVLCGCVSSPTQPPQTIGVTRAQEFGGLENIWMMKDDGSAQSPVNLGADGNSSMTWSPDGNFLAFESVRDGTGEIYTARVIDNGDGTYSAHDIQRRTTSSANNLFPAWSPHCAGLAFSSNRAEQNYYNIYQLDLSVNTVSRITNGPYEDLSPSWSPDGSKIAFTRNVRDASREIYVHVMSSGLDMRLTNNSVNDTDPSWSPSGRIIFARHSEDGSRAALFEMDAVDANGDGNGDHLDSISSPQADEYDRRPEYSGTGKAILFTRSREAGGRGPADVWKLVFQDGTVMEPLSNITQTTFQHEHGATWRRNGICVRQAK